MLKVLSKEQVSQYNRDGFVAPISCLTAADAKMFHAKFVAYEAAFEGWYELSKGQKLYLLQTWARDLGRHKKILDAVEDIMGPNLMVWGLSLFVKDAKSPSFVSWHQDSTYWGLSKPNVVTAWIALSSSNKRSGCMKMIPRSQKWGQISHQDTLAKENLLTRGQEIDFEIDDRDAVYIELEPGEISLPLCASASVFESWPSGSHCPCCCFANGDGGGGGDPQCENQYEKKRANRKHQTKKSK